MFLYKLIYCMVFFNVEYINFLKVNKVAIPEWYRNLLISKNIQIFITNSKNITSNRKLEYKTFSAHGNKIDVTKEFYGSLLESYEKKHNFEDIGKEVCIYAILNQDPTIVIGFAQISCGISSVELKDLATINSVKNIKGLHLLRNKFYLIGSCMLTAISLYSSYLDKDIYFMDANLGYYNQFIPYGLIKVNNLKFIIPKDKIIPSQDYYSKKVGKLVNSNPRLHIIEHYMDTKYYINLVKKYNENYITSPQSFNKFGFQSQPSLNKYLEKQKYQILKNYFKSWRVKVEDFKKVQYYLTTSVECSNKNCNQYIPLHQNKKVVFCSKCHTRTYVKS